MTTLSTERVRAQGLGNSPYSALGLGETYNQANAANFGMGGVGISNASPFYLNLQNPALLARRGRFTAFEVGLIGQYKPDIRQLRSGVEQSQRDFGANLNYVALAFPATSRLAMSIGLRPFSYVDYQSRSYGRVRQNNTNTIYETEYTYSGRGALNKASFATGYRVGKNIYLGGDFSYLFGNITNNSDAQVLINTTPDSNPDPSQRQPQDIVVSRINRVNYGDLIVKLGAAWRPKLSENWHLNVGATIKPGTNVRARETDVYQQVTIGSGDTGGGSSLSDEDTLRNNTTSNVRLPQQLNFGITLERTNKLTVGVDVGLQRWSQYRTVSGQPGNLSDAVTLAAGLEYTPKANSTKYWDLVTYRAGFQYNQTPYVVEGNRVADVNGSVGISFPMGSYFVNYMNISAQGGQRGVLTGSQIRERYVRFTLGFSLNDLWFRRPVLD
ncbi:MAG: hypothetical protein EAZ91_17395 [Cytophagales bacterium]|nr:MAG: hypothetical protein EAZ91_17395 [Cytophagales bacterium]